MGYYEDVYLKRLNRYGVDNPYKSEEIKNKSKQTKINRYGDANYNNRDKEESIQNPFFKGALRKSEKNSNFRSTLKDNLKEKANLNKSLSLSNSNILMKTSDDNIF